MKISAVYKIINTITNDFYIGSSKDVKLRWKQHKRPSVWKEHPNNPMYLDMQKYGVDKFDFQILANVEADQLKKTEQKFIEKLQPIYNNYRAKGIDTERYKKHHNKSSNKYNNQLCLYKGEILTLNTLAARFRKTGIKHYTAEAKKYILEK